jgi:hypothetical protein
MVNWRLRFWHVLPLGYRTSTVTGFRTRRRRIVIVHGNRRLTGWLSIAKIVLRTR